MFSPPYEGALVPAGPGLQVASNEGMGLRRRARLGKKPSLALRKDSFLVDSHLDAGMVGICP